MDGQTLATHVITVPHDEFQPAVPVDIHQRHTRGVQSVSREPVGTVGVDDLRMERKHRSQGKSTIANCTSRYPPRVTIITSILYPAPWSSPNHTPGLTLALPFQACVRGIPTISDTFREITHFPLRSAVNVAFTGNPTTIAVRSVRTAGHGGEDEQGCAHKQVFLGAGANMVSLRLRCSCGPPAPDIGELQGRTESSLIVATEAGWFNTIFGKGGSHFALVTPMSAASYR